MFDIGFSELLLVALVALLVFGPERLPGAVRTGSLWLGRLKRSVQSIKQEVEREIGADEIRQQLHNEEILRMERELKQSLQAAQASVEAPLNQLAGDLSSQTSSQSPAEPVNQPTGTAPQAAPDTADDAAPPVRQP